LDGGHRPKPAYSELIAKIGLGVPVYDGEIDYLPDPDLFRDALFLAARGTWSARDMDECDALLLALVRRIQNTRRK
jgi:hypothetical protein